ncbi:uncharacterized protein JCM6883_005550 [Sporobolomyces salmoneus]|uniref:uncharacterized protein n=1 Tax=Sporobolomyces salmoneus TaxID=183962 RepID=UPI00317E45F2
MSNTSHDIKDVEDFEQTTTARQQIDSQPEVHNDASPPAYTSGVLKVENAQRVWGRNSQIALFIGVALASYIYSLEGTTTYQYLAYATSSFSAHSLLGAIGTAQAIILAVTKPFAAKFADVAGRAEAFCLSAFFYCLGFIIIAACKDIHTYAAGAILYYIGYASLQILIQIVIADCTNLRWRGLVSSLVSIWFFINAFVSSNIAQGVLETSSWHWGYGMFVILIPVVLSPIIGTLFWAQHRAKKLGLDSTDLIEKNGGTAAKVAPRGVRSTSTSQIASSTWRHLVDFDALGLLLFGAGWACLLLPLTLVNRATLDWDNHKIIILLVFGGVILLSFIAYERFAASKPLFPFRFFKSWTILACGFIGFFDFVSFYLQYTYQYSFISVTRGWSVADQGYFAYTQTLCLTFGAIMAGFYQLYFHRTKWLLVCGLCVRLIGVGIMIKSKGAHGSTFFLVISQVIQGLGGGIASGSCQLLAQASVPHQEVASVTAFVLLLAEIGNAVGTAIASAIWRGHLPGELNSRLTGLLPAENITLIYGSITMAASYPKDSPIYEGVIGAYDEVMKILLIAATCIAVIPPLLALGINNILLTKAHNAVEGEDVAGRTMDDESVQDQKRALNA